MYSRILVPYDISAHSEKALDHAIKLAKIHGSTLVVLHVIPEIPFFPLAGHTTSPETGKPLPLGEYVKTIYEEVQRNASQMLKLKILTNSQSGINIEADVTVGDPVYRIVEYANNKNVDLIVLGSVGLGGFAKFKALGSVSRGVAERAGCPVLIIH